MALKLTLGLTRFSFRTNRLFHFGIGDGLPFDLRLPFIGEIFVSDDYDPNSPHKFPVFGPVWKDPDGTIEIALFRDRYRLHFEPWKKLKNV